MNEVKSSVLGEEEIEEIRRILKDKIAAGHHEKVMEFIISNGANFMKMNDMDMKLINTWLWEFEKVKNK